MNRRIPFPLWVASVTAVALLLSTRQAAAAPGPVPLTAMDYVQIQQLVFRLNLALDYCGHGGRDFADLFVEAGQFVIDEGDAKPRVFQGREQLATLAGGPDCRVNRVPPRSYIVHLAENLVIDVSPQGARGTSYAIYPPRKGKYSREDVAGQYGLYHDEYVRTHAGWRVKSRRHEVSPPLPVE